MAQIEQSNGGKKKKGAQKKMQIHVDFTPMVDMNMLLITFFMLCTTMIKSQTLQISLPSNEKVENEQKNQAKESEAFTFIVDTERDAEGNIKLDGEGKPMNVIYYYQGKPAINADGSITDSNLKVEYFIGNDGSTQRGIRKILHDRNKEVLAEIDKIKEQWRNKEFSQNPTVNDSIYQAKAKAIRNDNRYDRPVVIIKAGPNASWESLISALDEMQINQISRYQIDNITLADSALILDYKAKHPSK